MAALPKRRWTAEEYLAFERASEERHEFIGGDVCLMTGASREHNLITGNAFAALHAQLRGRHCEIYMADMRVRVQQREYVYPDVVVACGETQLEDDHMDTLLNPTLIIEVLSPSTEQYDRGKKFESYRALNSLQEYVLITQDRPHIERYVRQTQETWLFSEITGLDGSLESASIGCTFVLADIYEKVVFDDNSNRSQDK